MEHRANIPTREPTISVKKFDPQVLIKEGTRGLKITQQFLLSQRSRVWFSAPGVTDASNFLGYLNSGAHTPTSRCSYMHIHPHGVSRQL